jgi:hypothetical protein
MSEKKTKLMQDAEKAIANMELSKKEMESAREENAEKRETKDKAKSKEMESAREENAEKYGYKKGGLVRQGKPKLAKKGWR